MDIPNNPRLTLITNCHNEIKQICCDTIQCDSEICCLNPKGICLAPLLTGHFPKWYSDGGCSDCIPKSKEKASADDCIDLSKYGVPQKVRLCRSTYMDNRSLAISIKTEDGEYCGSITENLNQTDTIVCAKNMFDCAFVDVYNYPWAEQLLTDNGLAEKVDGIIGRSYGCKYPLYRFYLDRLPNK